MQAPATPRRIKPLPTLVANQIAAGEVVERPASVVKELVENAIDAGALSVVVEIEQGGIELVRISDDGSGMEPEDLPLAVAPHATSKIATAEDLDQVATLGFRGEALASIASVSRLSIRTRTRSADAASLLEVEGATAGPIRPASGPPGTMIAVRNLFFNTPARRKFLRTVQTEQERCLDAAKALALAHPRIAFSVHVDGRKVLELPPEQSPRQRTLGVLGDELAPQLLEVHADQFDDSRGVSLWGLAGTPAIAKGTAKGQHFFVNGRAVRDRTIQHAVAEAFRGLIEPGRYPVVMLMIEMSPKAVDVNVHPAKAEVRFRDGSAVHSIVLRALRDALRKADLTPTAANLRPQAFGFRPAPLPADLPGPGAVPTQGQEPGTTHAALAETKPAAERYAAFFHRQQPAAPPNFAYGEMKRSLDAAQSPLPMPTPASRVLQVHKSYLVTQDEQGVVIIDQHALHERVMFEYLLARVLQGGLESQRLLAPVHLEVSARQMELLPDLQSLLARIGIDAQPMGPRTIGVHAFPTFLFDRGVDEVEFLRELLEKAEDDAFLLEVRRSGENALRDVLDMMSCKAP